MQPTKKGETQSFYNAFFEIFGVRRRSVARYEEHVRKLDNQSGFIDLFWPGVLIVEQKSAGRNLARAYGQAGEYFDSLSERARPRYILVSDFQTFEGRNWKDPGRAPCFRQRFPGLSHQAPPSGTLPKNSPPACSPRARCFPTFLF